MAQRDSLTRHILIIFKLRSGRRATFQEIEDYLQRESHYRDLDLFTSKRTFQRDINDIDKIFGIIIRCDRSDNSYFIESEMDSSINDRLFEAFDMYNALKLNEQNREYIYLEKRMASGTEHFYSLLRAIKERRKVSFNYDKSYEGQLTHRTVKPLALKEFRYRWYLVARDENDEDKRFALDRITNLEVLDIRFPKVSDLDIDRMHAHSFGITVPPDYKVQKVVLSFTPYEGNYSKTLPFHPTQKVLIDNDKEFRISLDIYITFDFIMELLSLGDTVKVLEPQPLIQEIKRIYQKALKQY
jgi:predicted DNA-binding transcriptional regulator YafY